MAAVDITSPVIIQYPLDGAAPEFVFRNERGSVIAQRILENGSSDKSYALHYLYEEKYRATHHGQRSSSESMVRWLIENRYAVDVVDSLVVFRSPDETIGVKPSNSAEELMTSSPFPEQIGQTSGASSEVTTITPPKPFRIDPETGITYLPRWTFPIDKGDITKDNLRFIKVLMKHGQLESSASPLTRESIKRIVDDMDYDSDLWDDIYDNDDIFRSVWSAKDVLRTYRTLKVSQVSRKKLKESVRFYTEDARFSHRFESSAEAKKHASSRIRVFKWYIYLRRCAILYRDTIYKRPLDELLAFLQRNDESKKCKNNYKWLKGELRVLATRCRGENWNSGLHEWLTCKKTIEAIHRTAGLVPGFEPALPPCVGFTLPDERKIPYTFPEFNWLDLQLLLRSPNKYVIFRSRINTIETGHCGAVNEDLIPTNARTGFCKQATPHSPSESAFHRDLNADFDTSQTLLAFVEAVRLRYHDSIVHDRVTIHPVLLRERRFLVDGTTTDNASALERFQEQILVGVRRFIDTCYDDISVHEQNVKNIFERPS